MRLTKKQSLVLEFLKRSSKPLSIAEIMYKMKDCPDKVTLYRMMNKFSKENMVHRINLREGFERYEYQGKHHHHHIVCTSCDSVEHIKDIEIEKVLSRISGKSEQFKGELEHSLEFFGLCKKCQ